MNEGTCACTISIGYCTRSPTYIPEVLPKLTLLLLVSCLMYNGHITHYGVDDYASHKIRNDRQYRRTGYQPNMSEGSGLMVRVRKSKRLITQNLQKLLSFLAAVLVIGALLEPAVKRERDVAHCEKNDLFTG